jgi:hypothetical protein
MKTQHEQNARRTTGTVESSGTQAGGAVGRTAARAGQHAGAVEGMSGTEADASGSEKALALPLFPDIAVRRDFPLILSSSVTWCTIGPEPFN